VEDCPRHLERGRSTGQAVAPRPPLRARLQRERQLPIEDAVRDLGKTEVLD
jgi:hypothetical protein